MRIVTVTYVIDSKHNPRAPVTEGYEIDLEQDLLRVQDHSERGLQLLHYVVTDIPKGVK